MIEISSQPPMTQRPSAPTGGETAPSPPPSSSTAAESPLIHVMTPSAPRRSSSPTGRGRVTRCIALVNQKGGVGKTTTTVNLGAALSQMGRRVLLIDLDPQSHLTLHLGIEPDALGKSVYDLLTDTDTSALEVAQQVCENLVVLPAEVNLAGVEPELASMAATGKAQQVLVDKCAALLTDAQGEQVFDYVLIDCPPSLGLLTLNALALAREVIVPLQAHFLALQGLSKLLETVTLVKQAVNPELVVAGVILCMHEAQTILAGEVVTDLNEFLDAARGQDVPWREAQVYQPAIRRNIKLAESPSFGKTIFDYAPLCPGASDYRALAQAVIDQPAFRTHSV